MNRETVLFYDLAAVQLGDKKSSRSADLNLMFAGVAEATGLASYKVSRRVTILPSPVGIAPSYDLLTRTLVLELSHVRGLNSAEYRFGDLTKSFFRAVSGEEKELNPYVRITLVGKDISVRTQATKSTSRGDASIGETMLLPVPLSGPAEGSWQDILEFAVYNEVGIQNMLRGDPLIGSVSLPISSLGAYDVELTLVRDGKPRGQLHISRVIIEARPDRELTLAKAALITSVVGTHWGLAIGSGVHEMVAVGAANGGPTALLGPAGLIAHTIVASEWVEWKMALVAQRARGGFLGSEALAYYQRGEPIPDSQFRRLVAARPLSGFDALQESLGTRTLRTDVSLVRSNVCRASLPQPYLAQVAHALAEPLSDKPLCPSLSVPARNRGVCDRVGEAKSRLRFT